MQDEYSYNQMNRRNEPADYSNFEQSNDPADNNAMELLEIHNNFFRNIANFGYDVNSDQIQEVEKTLRSMIQNVHQMPGSAESGEHPLLSKIKDFMQTCAQKTEPKVVQKYTPNKQPENLRRVNPDQNVHPNINSQMTYEEDKFDQSLLEESSMNYQRNAMRKGQSYEPITPESAGKRQDTRENLELGERAQRFDTIHDQSPINQMNTYADGDDEYEDEKNEELTLNMQQRLTHKKWQIRK